MSKTKTIKVKKEELDEDFLPKQTELIPNELAQCGRRMLRPRPRRRIEKKGVTEAPIGMSDIIMRCILTANPSCSRSRSSDQDRSSPPGSDEVDDSLRRSTCHQTQPTNQYSKDRQGNQEPQGSTSDSQEEAYFQTSSKYALHEQVPVCVRRRPTAKAR